MPDRTASRERASDIPTVEEALQDPLAALLRCRESQKVEDKRIRTRGRNLAAAIYAAAWTCDRDPKEWAKVVRHANEHNLLARKIGMTKDKNRTFEKCARFVFQFTHTYDRAFKMARALDFCSNKGIQPERVRAFIKENDGIEKLYTRATKELPRRGKTFAEQQESRRLSREGKLFHDLDVNDEHDDAPPCRSSVRPSLAEVHNVVAELDDHVLIRLEPKDLHELLRAEIGSLHTIRFRLVVGNDLDPFQA